MKNLTIKKVALGLLLAGYAASGAFAAQSATSAKTIKGNAPILAIKGKTLTDTSDHDKVTVTAGSSNAVANKVTKIGDEVVFEFETLDADGDTVDSSKGSAKNLVVFYGKELTAGTITWTAAVTGGSNSQYTYDASNKKVTFKLGADAANAAHIGFKIQSETQFGDPDKGNILFASTLISTNNPSVVDPNDPTTPTPLPTDPGTPTPPTGPGDGGIDGGPTPTTPIPSAGAVFGIFKVGDGGNIISTKATDNYTNSGSAVLNLGEKFEMVYWDDVDSNGYVNGSETKYTITGAQWKVFGNNSAANGTKTSPNSATTAAATDWIIDGETNKQITLAVNSSVTIKGGSPLATISGVEAGLQGFRLQAYSTN